MTDDNVFVSPSPAGTKPVLMDRGVAWFIQQKLMEIREQIEKELTRDDLFEQVEKNLRIKRNSLNTVIGLVRGERGGKLNVDLHTEYVVLAEYPPEEDDPEGPIELYEAYDRDEAEALARNAEQDGALTTSYWVIPDTGNKIMVFYPVGDDDNQPKEGWEDIKAEREKRIERRAARRRVQMGVE